MDSQFPPQLFPSFYNSGPPVSTAYEENWGGYDRVRLQGDSGPQACWTFTSSHRAKGETWRLREPVPLPLLSPQPSVCWSQKPPDPMDFSEHMQNFFMDHSLDAFGCMAGMLGGNFHFGRGRKRKCPKDSVNMWKVKNALDMLDLKICHRTYSSPRLDSYGALMAEALHAVPPVLLGTLLHEELTEQRDRLLFPEGATGGALAFVPFTQSSSASELGCLLYPGSRALDRLNFHRVALQHHNVDTSSSEAFSFQLKGPIRQISSSSLLSDHCVAVRSDYFCGVWHFSESNKPRLLQVVSTKEVATCVSVSPHALGEVLVVSASGAANLWTAGRGMQRVRQEGFNLYFDAQSSWRWCEFSAHPRVMLYADRTGAELTDIRVSPAPGQMLFHIGSVPECRRGERLLLTRYLGDVHSFHHLITTQYSAYIVDERFPRIPMLKWDHMMQSPPLFCHVLGPASCGSTAGGDRTAKVLLGSCGSQEVTLLQYSGGRAEACSSRGPPQSLLRPKDSLKHLPVQMPHHLDAARDRLSFPATGLACIQEKGGQCICVLQLTDAGDVFYQILECEHPPAGGGEAARLLPASSSHRPTIGPGQARSAHGFEAMSADSSSDESESANKSRMLQCLGLQVVVNDPELDNVIGLEAGKVDSDETGAADGLGSGSISDGALLTWKHWLEEVKTPRPHRLQHASTETQRLHDPPGDGGEAADEEPVRSLRRHLKSSMSKRSLLVHSAASLALQPPDVAPIPNQVDTDHWTDPLSERLTLSWQGDAAWRAWWEDELGLNRKAKADALRRKRRREKKARRAGSQDLDLDLLGSFTSTVSDRSELEDFSPAPSQVSCSDPERAASRAVDFEKLGLPGAATPSNSPGCSQTPPIYSNHGDPGQRKDRRPLQAPQETFQHDRCFPKEGSPVRASRLPVASSSSRLPATGYWDSCYWLLG
ncbi:TATA box-binding protein-associated factor RNA polymerase I subunit C [Brachionichthys hirsutus]|uniref:TATA box-binding protein-associated factor RNA polymerase I subunit C n=1 Tax=Brachionichthys hirsutus TaxID=412623 RepID=UPI0036050D5D